MIVFPCHLCRTSLSAEQAQAGQLMRCPVCRTAVRVPVPASEPAAVGAVAPAASPSVGMLHQRTATSRFAGKRFPFTCGYCSSHLEATESMAAQEGQCPTCGNQITIPILDRYGRLIDPKTRQIIKQDPHPVHAYAAAGERAPRIIRAQSGKQFIVCPRCSAANTINANSCASCGMPFTMEGTVLEPAGTNNGFCVASLVLGILGVFTFFMVVVPVLAIVLGIIGWNQVSRPEGGGAGSSKAMAIAGMSLGAVGLLIALKFYRMM
jgi:DNA-directed RNA polymerase subunit RPC12/RpoP